MAVLNNEYEIASMTLMVMGFNGAMSDCELPKVKRKPVFCDDEVQIQHIADNKLLNKAGGLHKTGLTGANCRAVMEARKRTNAE